MKKKLPKYLRKTRWIALYKVTKRRLRDVPGDNFPVFALRETA